MMKRKQNRRQLKYTKDLIYPDENFRRQIVPQMVKDPSTTIDSMLEVAFLYTQQYEGTQIVVPKELTEEFKALKPAFSYGFYPWPSVIFELYFEDKNEPTVLACRMTNNKLKEMGFNIDSLLDGDSPSTHILMQERSGEGFTVQAAYDDNDVDTIMRELWTADDVIDGGKVYETSEKSGLDSEDGMDLAHALMMAFNAIALCGTSEVRQVDHKAIEGGQPGKNGRPQRPVFRIESTKQTINEDKTN